MATLNSKYTGFTSDLDAFIASSTEQINQYIHLALFRPYAIYDKKLQTHKHNATDDDTDPS